MAEQRGPGAIREFFSGVALLGRGFSVWRSAPGLMWLGLLPAAIVALVYLGLIILFVINADAITAWLTPFAAEWDASAQLLVRIVVTLALLVGVILLLVSTFVAISLAVGDPVYERIWKHVEQREGGAPAAYEPGFWKGLGRGIGDGLRVLLPTVLLGLLVTLSGLIPLVGAVIAPVLGALVGGWFVVVELTGRAFDARGHTLRERRKALGSRRALSLGFGVASYVLFLVPVAAIIVMPAAAAGSTLLARRVIGQDAEPGRPPAPAGP